MTEELARDLFLLIWGTGLAVWVWGLSHSRRMFRATSDEVEFSTPGFEEDPPAPGLVRGDAEVQGSPAALAGELAGRLAGVLGSTFVVRSTPEGLTFTNTLPPAFNQTGWANVSAGRLSIQRAGMGRSRVGYELDLRPLTRRLGRIALVLALAVGLPVLLVVGGLIWFLVIPSNIPAVRWQVLQAFQVAHALWPPFLVTSRLRASAAVAQASLRAAIIAAGEAVGG